jgi:hypothetical protein
MSRDCGVCGELRQFAWRISRRVLGVRKFGGEAWEAPNPPSPPGDARFATKHPIPPKFGSSRGAPQGFRFP